MERIALKAVVFRAAGFSGAFPLLVDLESTTLSAAVPGRPPASVALMLGDNCGPAALTSVVRASCYTMPCFFLRVSSSAWRSSMSAFDLAILSGWWYNTGAVGTYQRAWDVRTDEIAVLEVEAVQLVAGLLGIQDFLVNDECGPLGVVGDALADLAVR
jgi:hypothetical protein